MSVSEKILFTMMAALILVPIGLFFYESTLPPRCYTLDACGVNVYKEVGFGVYRLKITNNNDSKIIITLLNKPVHSDVIECISAINPHESFSCNFHDKIIISDSNNIPMTLINNNYDYRWKECVENGTKD